MKVKINYRKKERKSNTIANTYYTHLEDTCFENNIDISIILVLLIELYDRDKILSLLGVVESESFLDTIER